MEILPKTHSCAPAKQILTDFCRNISRGIFVETSQTEQTLGENLFLSLPLEIRELVYQHLFGPTLIHIQIPFRQRCMTFLQPERLQTSRQRGLVGVKCREANRYDGWDGHHHEFKQQENISPVSWKIVHKPEPNNPNDRMLAICLTCRQM